MYLSMKQSLFQIDDPLDAVAVHGVGGLIGLFAAPILMDSGELACLLLPKTLKCFRLLLCQMHGINS